MSNNGGMDAERAITARLRGAGSRASGSDIRLQLEELAPGPSARLPDPDLRVSLLVNVARNQGSFDVAADRSAAVACIGNYLTRRFGRRKLVAGKDPRLAALPWREAGLLPRFGLIEEGDRAALSYASLAVAETGSVVMLSGRDNPASNNLLPEDHIVLLDDACMVETLDDIWGRIGDGGTGRRPPRGIQLISGPSSTADIGLQLVVGAHGPCAWHVILVTPDAEVVRERVAALLASN